VVKVVGILNGTLAVRRAQRGTPSSPHGANVAAISWRQKVAAIS